MLCYVDDELPGITRRKSGSHWAYFSPRGTRIKRRSEIDRLNAIALPPAYRDAWFCPSATGHIQAVGWDEKGRKQYRYHPDFRARQEADKYDRLTDFGRALPKIRARVEADLAGRALGKDAVLAAVVRLLDLGRVRVGNEGYAQANKSFGATTLRTRHATVKGSRLKLEYMGKSGKMQRLTIEDNRLSRLVRRCADLPGQNLFQYLAGDGAPHPVSSSDVNAWLRDAAGGRAITAKHFRTWGASVIAFRTLIEAGGALPLKAMLEPVAQALGNTPAIARKSYVHPALIALAHNKGCAPLEGLKLPRATRYLSGPERGLIAFLDELADAPGQNASEAA
ncbi:DNA topoisomerase IB [Sphingomonas solaris]|uniref:DNA topoisomerase n=1 Tax=Alterirhizorhabdus solaris TaxID=2529389 RepID=A0A558QSC8_9SPHN|nr:DNA topoisomerase IB [Sphingomonas solaris]TVV70051.1 DNA topoisomerase IB [Sphingomonas solaris]